MKKAYSLAGISILFWSSVATISKLLLGIMNSYQVLCVSALFAAATLFIIVLLNGKLERMKQYRFKDYCIMVLIGLPGTFLYYIFLYAGTDRMLASQAFIVNYLWPIMSVVFSCLLLREKMTVRKAIAIIMSFSGILTVAGKDLVQFNPRILTGILLCICAAVSYGAFTALNKKYHYDTQVSMMVSFFAAFLLSLLTNLLMGTDFHITPLQIAGLAWNGIFVMALATTTWALALNLGDTAKISNLAYITPFLSLIWTNLFLQEPVDLWSVSGLVIIVLGIFIQLKDKHA